MSDSFISLLKREVDLAIERGYQNDCLIDYPTEDDAIAFDETFFKIEGHSVYVLIARGYLSKKVIGLRVSFSRKEHDIREVFEEAQTNSSKTITTASIDAWGPSIKFFTELGRPFTLIIHRHKKPYDKAVIRQIDYDGINRVITETGVKTDIFIKSGKREVKYDRVVQPLALPQKRSLGRPIGSKKKKL